MCSPRSCLEKMGSLRERETDVVEACGSDRLLASAQAHVATPTPAFSEGRSMHSAPSPGEESSASLSFAGSSSASISDLSAESVADIDEVSSREDVGDSSDLISPGISRPNSPGDHQERVLKRSSSESSLVTSDPPHNNGWDVSGTLAVREELDVSSNTILKMESSNTGWTDDKHSSYLNSIEATFVKNMYDREYCALDLCGQTPGHTESAEQDCVESRPMAVYESDSNFKMFMSWQKGSWQPVTFTRQLLPDFSRRAVLRNPWIKHFRSAVAAKAPSGSIHDPHMNLPCTTDTCGEATYSKFNQEFPKESAESFVETIPHPNRGVQIWQERLQSHLNTSCSPTAKNELDATTLLKRGPFGVMNGDSNHCELKQRPEEAVDQMEDRVASGHGKAQIFHPLCAPFQIQSAQCAVQLACGEPTKQDSCRTSNLHSSCDGGLKKRGPEKRAFKMQRTDRACQIDSSFDQVVPQARGNGVTGGPIDLLKVEHPNNTIQLQQLF